MHPVKHHRNRNRSLDVGVGVQNAPAQLVLRLPCVLDQSMAGQATIVMSSLSTQVWSGGETKRRQVL
jgi:hypothetical protein